jgi:hypothetical protein
MTRSSNLLGVHLVSTTYGTWLPGDERGHWSPVVGPDGRLVYPVGGPNPGDPATHQRAQEWLKFAPVVWTPAEQAVVARAFGDVTSQCRYTVYAAAVRATHVHWVMGDVADPLATVVWRYKGIAGKAVRQLRGPGSVWTDGYFKVYLFDEPQMTAALLYVERHNLENGLAARPWDWISEWREPTPVRGRGYCRADPGRRPGRIPRPSVGAN